MVANNNNCSGAMSGSTGGGNRFSLNRNADVRWIELDFNANKFSTVYKNNASVTPCSLALIFVIKY